MGSHFTHIELATDDVARAKEFYRSLFGWKLTDIPGMQYTMLDTGEPPGGGIYQRPPDVPVGWSVYVGVPDAAAAIDRARSLGATVIRDRTAISPEHGFFAVLRDPTGGVICLHEPAPRAGKPVRRRKPGRKPAVRKGRKSRKRTRR